MTVKAQISMTFNLEKCIGCNTCTVACKNVWTNREGAEYMWWNNVETKPGIGYPKQWENQQIWKGGWVKSGNKLKLRYGGKAYMLSNLFYNPHTPEMADYYGTGDVYTFTYEDLQSPEKHGQQPVARPKSMVTEIEEVPIDWGVNWEDNAGGAHVTGKYDVNFRSMSKQEVDATLKFRDIFYFYLPRICNHCLNPGCVGACPTGSIEFAGEAKHPPVLNRELCVDCGSCQAFCSKLGVQLAVVSVQK